MLPLHVDVSGKRILVFGDLLRVEIEEKRIVRTFCCTAKISCGFGFACSESLNLKTHRNC